MLGFAELVKPESFSLLTMLTLYPGISFKKKLTFLFLQYECTAHNVHCTVHMADGSNGTVNCLCICVGGWEQLSTSCCGSASVAHCWELVATETTVAAKCSFHCGSFHQAADSLLRSTSSIQLF